MLLILGVGLAAAAGAVCRYLLDIFVGQLHEQTFPWGTFVVNVSGCLALGLLMGWSRHHGLGNDASTVVGVGFLGGYTTWSTYLWESLALAQAGAYGQAALNLTASLATGLAAGAAGFGLALL
jgi:CrcB protein